MTVRTIAALAPFAAALLTCAASAQHADIQHADVQRRAGQQTTRKDYDQLQLDVDRDQRPQQGDRAAPDARPYDDRLERDRGGQGLIGQVPAQAPAQRRAGLQARSLEGGVELTFEREAQEQPWIGVILGSLDRQLVDFAPGMPPLLGQSAVLAAAVLDPDNPDQTVRAKVRQPGYDLLGFYAQGVAFTMRGVEATDVARAGFARR
jgi:hypothetical protein